MPAPSLADYQKRYSEVDVRDNSIFPLSNGGKIELWIENSPHIRLILDGVDLGLLPPDTWLVLQGNVKIKTPGVGVKVFFRNLY